MMTSEQLAEAVARVKELNAKRTHGKIKIVAPMISVLREDGHGRNWYETQYPTEYDAQFWTLNIQMAAIIAQQDAIIQQQREVMRMAGEVIGYFLSCRLAVHGDQWCGWRHSAGSSVGNSPALNNGVKPAQQAIAALDAALKGGE